MIKFAVQYHSMSTVHESPIVLFYNKCMLCISCHFGPLKPTTLWMNHAKLFDDMTSLPISHAILSRGMCFATSRPAIHATCSYYYYFRLC